MFGTMMIFILHLRHDIGNTSWYFFMDWSYFREGYTEILTENCNYIKTTNITLRVLQTQLQKYMLKIQKYHD